VRLLFDGFSIYTLNSASLSYKYIDAEH